MKNLLYEKGYSIKSASEKAGISNNTLSIVCNGGSINEDKAQSIADLLQIPAKSLFNIRRDNTPFSNKTILEYHRFISSVLEQADKEMLIPFNPARKATPPKAKPHQANYFQIEDIALIRDCLEKEPIKWKTLVHLLLITGARRGEIAGLKRKPNKIIAGLTQKCKACYFLFFSNLLNYC